LLVYNSSYLHSLTRQHQHHTVPIPGLVLVFCWRVLCNSVIQSDKKWRSLTYLRYLLHTGPSAFKVLPE